MRTLYILIFWFFAVELYAVDITQMLSMNTNDGVALTTNLLNSFTFGRVASGRWQVITNGTGSGTGSAEAPASVGGVTATISGTVFPGHVTITNQNFTDPGTTCYRYDHNWTSPKNSEFLHWNIGVGPQDPATLSIGFYFMFGVPHGYYNNYDIAVLEAYSAGGNGGAYINITTGPTQHYIRTETLSSGTIWGSNVPITTNYLYWLTLSRSTITTNCMLWVYDPSTWSLVGASSSIVSPGSSNNVYGLDFGVQNAGAEAAPGYSYFGDIWIDTNGTFPLLPQYDLTNIIPTDRVINWSKYIPTIPDGWHTNTISVTDYGAVGNGVSDDYLPVQNAINAATWRDIVYFPAGTYRITNGISVSKSILLKGAGPSLSKLLFTSVNPASDVVYRIVTISGSSSSTVGDLASDSLAGSFSIQLSDASSFAAGNLLLIDQSNDMSVIRGDCTWCGRDGGDRARGQMLYVTNKSGNTLTFETPLYFDYRVTNGAQVQKQNILTNAGIEDMLVADLVPSDNFPENIRLGYGMNLWARNVWSTNCSVRMISLIRAYKSTVQQCYVREGWNYTTGPYGISLGDHCTSCLVQDNIAVMCRVGVQVEMGASGNVIAYNYLDHGYDTSNHWMMKSTGTHGAHPVFNLYEGNSINKFTFDLEHGNASLQTAFRNHTRRTNYFQSRASTNGLRNVDIMVSNVTMNFVGNVFGLTNQTYTSMFVGTTLGETRTDLSHYIMCLGYLSDGNRTNTDITPYQSLYYHGNWDYCSNVVWWSSSNLNHTIPSSLYLSSKPSWFGTLTWPPIGPDVSGLANMIPAEARYNGVAYSVRTAHAITARVGTIRSP